MRQVAYYSRVYVIEAWCLTILLLGGGQQVILKPLHLKMLNELFGLVFGKTNAALAGSIPVNIILLYLTRVSIKLYYAFQIIGRGAV